MTPTEGNSILSIDRSGPDNSSHNPGTRSLSQNTGSSGPASESPAPGNGTSAPNHGIPKLVGDRREVITYLVVGCLTTLVSWVTYALLRLVIDLDHPLQVQAAVVLRWVAGVSFAYVTNRIFVFRSKSRRILQEIVRFVSSRIGTLLIEMLVMWLCVSVLGINDWAATLLAAVIVTILNYLFSKLLVFSRKSGSL